MPLTEDGSSPLVGKVVLFNRVLSSGGREEGDTHLASQTSRVSPGNQWGDRCRNQMAWKK